jgi:peroxiredoxin
MHRTPGSRISNIRLPALDGTPFDLDRLRGQRLLLAFFRFASCPFCNLRVHELVTHYPEFGDRFAVVAIFESSPDHLRRYAARHAAPFPVLADEHGFYYREYGIERSLAGTVKGVIGRLPALLHAMFVKRYLPLTIRGHLTTMPADFLVDEQGVIRTAYYGRDEGDHLPLADVCAFALGDGPDDRGQRVIA